MVIWLLKTLLFRPFWWQNGLGPKLYMVMAFSGLCFSPLPWSKRPPFSNVLANIVGVWSIVSLARTTNRSTKTVRSHFMYDYFNVGLIWASLRFLVLGCEPRKTSLDIYEHNIFWLYYTKTCFFLKAEVRCGTIEIFKKSGLFCKIIQLMWQNIRQNGQKF